MNSVPREHDIHEMMISCSLVSIDVQQHKLASFPSHAVSLIPRPHSCVPRPHPTVEPGNVDTFKHAASRGLPGGLSHVAEGTCTRAEVVPLKAGRGNGPREQHQTICWESSTSHIRGNCHIINPLCYCQQLHTHRYETKRYHIINP